MLLKKTEPAPFTGYLFTEKTTKDIANGWQAAEGQNLILSRAYEDLKRESYESIHALRKEIAVMNEELINADKQARRARHRRSFWTVTTSLVIGGIIGAVIHNNR